MKPRLKKYCYSIIIIAMAMLFGCQISLGYNLHEESGSNITNSSGESDIPFCRSCDSNSEPMCTGSQSPLCSADQSIPTCQLTGDFCNPTCPSANIAGGNSPFCSTKYLIIDGDGAGIQIHSIADNPSKILISTITGGLIKEPDEKCPGPNSHFNGYLINYSDPAPNGCGWGHVVIFKKLPERLSLLLDSIETTLHARSETESLGIFFGAALIEVNNVSIKLKELKDLIVKSKDIKSGKKKMILRRVELIFKQAEIAKSNLSSLDNAQNPSHTAEVDPNQRDAARTALSKALDYEMEIFKILLKFETIQ